jgi:drug/metabolite transporter (DMT)-like permease
MMLTAVLLILRISSNPLSNLFQKKIVAGEGNSRIIILMVHSFLLISVLPYIITVNWNEYPVRFYEYMIICSLFAVASNVMLVEALKFSDLSIIGPINSYKPIIGMVFGLFIINEVPNLTGILGVLLIIAGSYMIAGKKSNENAAVTLLNFMNERGVKLRFGALLFSGTEAVFLKKAMMFAPASAAFIFWCFFCFLFSVLAVILFRPKSLSKMLRGLAKEKYNYLFLVLTTGVMQYSTLLIFQKMNVAYALALFQISSLISVVLGYKYFSERNIKKRIIGSIIMIAGASVIILFGA